MATYRTSAAGGSTSGTSNRTAAITPAVGDLLVGVVFVSTNTNDTPTMTDNNGSGTYTRILVADVTIAAVAHRMSVFVRDALMVNTTSTTVTANTGSNTSGAVHVVAISGMSRVGADAVRSQGQQNNQAAGTPAPALNQSALTGNVTIVGVGSGDTTTTAPTNWTERQDTNFATPTIALETATRDSGFTGTTITFGAAQSTTFASFAIEMDGSTDLVIANGTHAHSAANLALTQVHALTVANASHAQSAANLALTQSSTLAIANGSHGHSAGNLDLTQAAVLAIQDATHGHSAGSLVLTQVHELATQNASHGHTASNVGLTQAHELGVDGANHGHEAQGLSLTQVHVLAVEDATHAHSSENVSLGVAGTLGIQDAVHGHTSDEVTLSTATDLQIDNATHGHTADNVVLEAMLALVIQGATHGHTAESLALTQLHELGIANALHGHMAANVVLIDGSVGTPVEGPTRAVGPRSNRAAGSTGRTKAIGRTRHNSTTEA